MAREIERKFLVEDESWKALAHKKTHFAQGYLTPLKGAVKSSVRVRIEGERANINIKSLEIGLSRDEYEYSIPMEDAEKMLKTLAVGPVIEKMRYLVNYGSHTWEIDEFYGDNSGLIVAEVEMASENDEIAMPEWAGKEVTHEARYYNISLSEYPYQSWNENEKKGF
ncbi:CYTH domain-containing protein [Thiomicrorhabdus sp. 6S3-12]|uniref:CYTH domain-containing protein n=1 Tax=Thiomicrorhabdus sp. 6S3-12 TaxID=2819681 RepID=UPI001AAD54DF|nr:CYTH domain-containing protein [Thiomicrorhabdus sp. 6S3-12]MBO1924940.1 CYTH domain-containing protein [Thiomicrorhabdus sp. 6S3-12]